MLLLFLFLSFNEAKIAYNNGLYGIAKLGFVEALNSGENKKECYYYLTKIADAMDATFEIYQWGAMFVDEYPLDKRSSEIAVIILKSCIEQKWTFGVKYFLQHYNQLFDKKDISQAVDSIIKWQHPEWAAQILLESGDKRFKYRAIELLDSIGDYNTVAKLAVDNQKGLLYRCNGRIEVDDTVGAFFDFLSLDHKEIVKKNLYGRLALFFGLAKMAKMAIGRKGNPLLWARIYLTEDNKITARKYLAKLPKDSLKQHLRLCLEAEYSVSPVLLIDAPNNLIAGFYELAFDKGNLGEAYLLASLLNDHEKKTRVRNLIFKEKVVQETVDSTRLLAQRYEKAEKYDSAYRYYYQLRDYEGLARVLYHLGNYQQAYRLTKKDSLRFLILKAQGKDASKIIRRNLDKSWASLEYARELLVNKKPEQALVYLFKCKNPTRLHLIVDALDQLGKDELSLKLIYAYGLEDRKSLAVLYAQDNFNQILHITKSGRDSLHRFYRMRALVRKGRFSRAREILRETERPAYYESVCEYLISKNRFTKLESLVSRIKERTPKIEYLEAMLPFYHGRFDTAVKSLKNYLSSSKQFRSEVIFKLGTSYYQLGEFEQAKGYFQSLLTDRELKDDAIHNLIICLKKIGAWDEIINLQSKIDDDPRYLFDIAYAYLRKGLNRRAITVFEQVRKNDYNAEVQYWLAEAKSGAGDLKGALLEYYRLYLDFPDDPQWRITAYFKMGLILEIMGDKDGAKEIYRNIMKRGEGDVWYKEAKNRLDNID